MHITKLFLFILVMAQVLLPVLGTGYYGVEFWKFGKKRPAYGKTWNRINIPMYYKNYPWTNPYYPSFSYNWKPKNPHWKYKSAGSDHVSLSKPIIYTSFLPPLYVKTLPYLPPTTVSKDLGNILPIQNPVKIESSKQVENPNYPSPYKPQRIMMLKVIKGSEKNKPAIENDVTLAEPNKPFPYLSEMPKSKTTVVLLANKDKPTVPDSALNITDALPKPEVSFEVKVVDIPNNQSESVIETPNLFPPETMLNELSPITQFGDAAITSDNPGNNLVKTAETPAPDNVIVVDHPAPDIAMNQLLDNTAVYPLMPTPGDNVEISGHFPDIDGNQMADAVPNHLLFDNQALDLSNLGIVSDVAVDLSPKTLRERLLKSIVDKSTPVGVSVKLLDVNGDHNPGDIMTADIVVPNFQLNNNMAFIDVGDGKEVVTWHGNLDGFQGQNNDGKKEDVIFEIPEANNEIFNPFIGFDRDNKFVGALGAGDDLQAVIQQTDLNLDRFHSGRLLITNSSISTGRRPVTITRNPFYLMLNIEPFGPGPYGQCREPARVVCGARYGWDHVIGMTEWCQHNCVVFMYSSYCDDDRCECECK